MRMMMMKINIAPLLLVIVSHEAFRFLHLVGAQSQDIGSIVGSECQVFLEDSMALTLAAACDQIAFLDCVESGPAAPRDGEFVSDDVYYGTCLSSKYTYCPMIMECYNNCASERKELQEKFQSCIATAVMLENGEAGGCDLDCDNFDYSGGEPYPDYDDIVSDNDDVATTTTNPNNGEEEFSKEEAVDNGVTESGVTESGVAESGAAVGVTVGSIVMTVTIGIAMMEHLHY